MSVKLAIPDHLKTKTFQNKAYDVIIINYDVIGNILLRYSNYISMWSCDQCLVTPASL